MGLRLTACLVLLSPWAAAQETAADRIAQLRAEVANQAQQLESLRTSSEAQRMTLSES